MWARAVWLGLRASAGGRRGFPSKAAHQVEAGASRRVPKRGGRRSRPHP